MTVTICDITAGAFSFRFEDHVDVRRFNAISIYYDFLDDHRVLINW